MSNLRNVYAEKAIRQIPRLLSLQDRNPYSPTYGCFHRAYWLDKTSDFPDAVRQFSTHALALAYRHEMPGNIYYGQDKIRDWAIAGLDFWAGIQHGDGSFDEFYPFERGWVGPSAFTTFTSIETYNLLQDDIPDHVADRILTAIKRAASFIAKGESEEDHLANHHAMACLALWKAYDLLDDLALKRGFERAWHVFLDYHNASEGWSREYDGVDPGYLSATVSFLGKVYQDNPDPDIFEVLQESVEFCSYFAYPNGFYAGSLGSRNTLHFYPHGFEILADKIPLAAAVADKMLRGLSEDKLVPPEIMSDRYVVYRTPEFLQAYLDYGARPAELPALPHEREQFTEYFSDAGIFVANQPKYYLIANLAKGGVVKVFDRETQHLRVNDCGIIGRQSDGTVVTTQWIDPDYTCEVDDYGWRVAGYLQEVPSNKLFTPMRNILFRATLVSLGWIPSFSHFLKRNIRKTLILGQRSTPIRFSRRLSMETDHISIIDELQRDGDVQLEAVSVGDEFFVRYVPQSRYFQTQELGVQGHALSATDLQSLNQGNRIRIERTLSTAADSWSSSPVHVKASDNGAAMQNSPSLPDGVYDASYYVGRQSKRQLIYRLHRRTHEVEQALRRYSDDRGLSTVVDVGTADALMLDLLRERMPQSTFLGIDYSFGLLRANPESTVEKLQGDAQQLPLLTGSADALIATAIIEHVPSPRSMMWECNRILRTGGLVVLTTPTPHMERIATAIGLLKDAGHQETFNLGELREMAEETGFDVLEARKFMFSPVGFPAEQAIERILGPLGLQLIMANQLLIARKRG